MAKTRRSFLKIAAVAAGSAAVAGGVLYRYARGAAADFYRRLVELDKTAPVGALGDRELAALMAATRVLLVGGIDERRYEDFFRWKAANAEGYKNLYEQFRATVDGAAGGDFAAAAIDRQKEVMAKAARVRQVINADDKVGGMRFALFDRDWLLFERYVVREILTLFARTDAWVLSGYGPHPGVPRGLEAYRHAPESATP